MLVAAAALLRMFWVLPSAGVMSASIVTGYLYVAAFLVWGASVRNRLLPTPMRTCAVSSAWCMVAWMVVRCFKYSATYFLPALGRLCWYAYYPLMLALAVLFFAGCAHAALHEDGRRLRLSVAFAGTCAVVLSVAVLTNDLHQCAFAFAGGVPDENGAYSLGPVYWAVVVLIAALVAVGNVWLVKGSRESNVGWRLAIPFVILALAFVYLFALNGAISFAFRSVGLEAPFLFAETCCIAALLVWEWLVRCRIIPGNDRCGELFAAMDAPALVTDAGLVGVYATARPLNATCGQLAAALDGPVMIAEGVELHGVPIRAGHVFWTADVAELAQMAGQLEEVAEQLAERNEIIAAENELSERRERIAARARVYADAEAPLAADIGAMRDVVARMQGAGAASPDELLAQTVRLAFVKRAMNLRLSGAVDDCASAEDVRACLAEMARCLKLAGVKCSAACIGDGTVDVDDAVGTLRAFARIAGGLHGRIRALLATVDADKGCLNLVLEPRWSSSDFVGASSCSPGDDPVHPVGASSSSPAPEGRMRHQAHQPDADRVREKRIALRTPNECRLTAAGELELAPAAMPERSFYESPQVLANELLLLGVPATVEDGAVYARIDFGWAGGGA